MIYNLINKNTNKFMRGKFTSREAARQRKRAQRNPSNWLIAQRITASEIADGGSCVTKFRYVR